MGHEFSHRVDPLSGNPAEGVLRMEPAKASWFFLMVAGSALAFAGPWEPGPILCSAGLAALGLCCGHSVGLHRLLIHGAFSAPPWLERGLVWLAVLCGLGGPLSLLRHHEVRDWAQRMPESHPWFGHAMPFFRDLWWQLVGHVSLKQPPKIQVEAWIQQDPFYRWLERYWMLQQLPLAVLAYAFGGLEWLLWLVPVRVMVGLVMHQVVGHLAHNYGPLEHIPGNSVQGHNLPLVGLLSFGEGYHNNHHRHSRSARLGFGWQLDAGWLFIRVLMALGLAKEVRLPGKGA